MRRISGSSTARLERNRAERGGPTGYIRKPCPEVMFWLDPPPPVTVQKDAFMNTETQDRSMDKDELG